MREPQTKILLVEASENVIALISNHLTLLGESVSLSIARSIEEAKACLASQWPNLVFANFDLPDGSGTDLLPGGDAPQPFPLVLLASHRSKEFSRRTFMAGAQDYLPLIPADLADLPYFVERTLREWRQIHQCREAEHALRLKEEKYRLLFGNMTEALALDEIIRDDLGNPIDWRVLDINPAYEEIFRIPREAAVGRLASELYGQDLDIKSILASHVGVAGTGTPVKMEIYFPPTKRHLLVSAFALGGDRFATLSTDITERKKFEIENERLLAELEATINAIAEAVIIYLPDGRIKRMNPAAEALLGYSAEEREKPLIERTAHLQMQNADGRPFPLESTMQRVFSGETLCGVITVFHRPDGRTVWMSNSAAPIRRADGQLLGAVGISTDITTLHDLQEQRDTCLHSVSHDLRSPMTVIQGYAEFLLEKISEEHGHGDWEKIVEEMLKGSQRMTRMIDELVETARSEGGQIKLEKSPVKLRELASALMGGHRHALVPERLHLDIPDDLPRLYVDPERWERVLVNLISNAMKYSPEGSPVVLSARATADLILLSIKDSGTGIDPEDLPHIFERFYCGRKNNKTDSVGLGLYIAKKLVEAHGGWISVESKPAAGSTFTITLPR